VSLPLDATSLDVPNGIDSPWLIPYERENPTNGNFTADLLPSQRVDARENITPVVATAFPSTDVHPVPPAAAAQNFAAPRIETEANPGLNATSASTTPDNLAPAHFQPPVDSSVTDALRIVPVESASAEPTAADPLRNDLVRADPFAPADKLQPYPWGSAKKAQAWLETVKTNQGPRAEWLAQQWQRRRANIYVVMAAVILLLVISGWGIRPAGTKAAGNAVPAQNSKPQAPPPPQLTLFEKLMVNLGLAEPPPAPVYMGNPNAQVWVDVHTALYYCSGSDLYGKTADGKFTTQRDAQQDQFEPSNRKACP